jgi:two-component system NarL family response regulator
MIEGDGIGRATTADRTISGWGYVALGGTTMGAQTLLIVDDNTFFRRVATRFLTQMADLEVVGAASSVEEAVLKAAELRPQVVLVDLNMPHTSGLTLIPQLRQLLPNVKIVVLTMWDNEIYRQAALAAGADDFVPKAQINTNLLPALRRLRALPLTS